MLKMFLPEKGEEKKTKIYIYGNSESGGKGAYEHERARCKREKHGQNRVVVRPQEHIKTPHQTPPMFSFFRGEK